MSTEANNQPADASTPRLTFTIDFDALCKQCTFNLRGLRSNGNCPECGLANARSLAGNELKHSSSDYLDSLRRGLTFILVSAIAQLFLGLVMLAVTFLVTFFSGPPGSAMQGPAIFLNSSNSNIATIGEMLALPLALLSLYGWWLFSMPDPGIRVGDSGGKPRKLVRIATIILVATNVLSVLAYSYSLLNQVFIVAAEGVAVIAFFAGIVQVFASLQYIRWLGGRIPSQPIIDKAGQYRWLLPVIYIFGACIAIGPIIAVIMYLLLLHKVLIALNSIRSEQRLYSDAQMST